MAAERGYNCVVRNGNKIILCSLTSAPFFQKYEVFKEMEGLIVYCGQGFNVTSSDKPQYDGPTITYAFRLFVYHYDILTYMPRSGC